MPMALILNNYIFPKYKSHLILKDINLINFC